MWFVQITPLFIQNQAIPIVSSYKYLGVPHKNTGIDWTSYTTALSQKVTSFITSLSSRRLSWPVSTRLIIWKTFIRPIGEYCLSLIVCWLKRQLNSVKSFIMSKLQQVHIQSMQFIFGKSRPLQVLESMSGIGPLTSRLQVLLTSTCKHLINLAPENPLFHLLNQPLTSDRNHFIPLFSSNHLYTSFNKQEPPQVTWGTFIKRFKMKQLNSYQSILNIFILNSCRNSSQVDEALLQDSTISHDAIQWRTNYFPRKKCPRCHQEFNKAHLSRCQVLTTNILYNQILKSDSYNDDILYIKDKFNQAGIRSPLYYDPLDYTLNSKDYQSFSILFNLLKSILV